MVNQKLEGQIKPDHDSDYTALRHMEYYKNSYSIYKCKSG